MQTPKFLQDLLSSPEYSDKNSETIKSINTIPDSKVNEFMVALKNERIDYLKDTKNWETAKNGWLKRVNKY